MIGLFEGTLQQLAVIALFMTVLSGEAGNMATQAITTVVRGLATGDVHPSELARVVGREMATGLILGLPVGAILMVTVGIWKGDWVLAAVIGLALCLTLPIAAGLGGFFPIIIERLGIDPAVSSGPFITTLTDVISMCVYFGLVTATLPLLLR